MVMHRKRCWGVARRSREELAELLTSMTWTLCTAFETEGGSVWANDATSEDGAGEYALLRFLDGQWKQVDSITAGWALAPTILRLHRLSSAGGREAGWIPSSADGEPFR